MSEHTKVKRNRSRRGTIQTVLNEVVATTSGSSAYERVATTSGSSAFSDWLLRAALCIVAGPTRDNTTGIKIRPCEPPANKIATNILKKTRNTSLDAKARGTIATKVEKNTKRHGETNLLHGTHGALIP